MPCGEKSLVFVYCTSRDCNACLEVVRELHDYDTFLLHWDGIGEATDDELAAFYAADYRLLIDPAGAGDSPNQAPRQMFDRALRTGQPTTELSPTAPPVTSLSLQGHVVSRALLGPNLSHDLRDAVAAAGWRPTQPWRVTALAELFVSALGRLRPLELLKAVLPCLKRKGHDPADWWVPLSTCMALGSWLLTRRYRLLLAVLLPWPWLAQAVFGRSVALPLVFACFEIVSIVVTQVEILFLAQTRAERSGEVYRRASRERSLLCALLNYATIVFWFASFYQWFPWLFATERGLVLTRPLEALYLSLANMSLMGAAVEPRHPCGRIILLAQLALGLFMALVVVAQAVGNITHRSTDES